MKKIYKKYTKKAGVNILIVEKQDVMQHDIEVLIQEGKMGLRQWAKLLPYFIVAKYVRKFSADFIKTDQLGSCRGFRVSPGEWILWSQQNYERMMENRKKEREWERQEKEQDEKEMYERLKKKFKK